MRDGRHHLRMLEGEEAALPMAPAAKNAVVKTAKRWWKQSSRNAERQDVTSRALPPSPASCRSRGVVRLCVRRCSADGVANPWPRAGGNGCEHAVTDDNQGNEEDFVGAR